MSKNVSVSFSFLTFTHLVELEINRKVLLGFGLVDFECDLVIVID